MFLSRTVTFLVYMIFTAVPAGETRAMCGLCVPQAEFPPFGTADLERVMDLQTGQSCVLSPFFFAVCTVKPRLAYARIGGVGEGWFLLCYGPIARYGT